MFFNILQVSLILNERSVKGCLPETYSHFSLKSIRFYLTPAFKAWHRSVKILHSLTKQRRKRTSSRKKTHGSRTLLKYLTQKSMARKHIHCAELQPIAAIEVNFLVCSAPGFEFDSENRKIGMKIDDCK